MSANGSRSIGRRSLLTAGAAGALAVAVEALGAPARIAAADHDPVKLGEFNNATGLTRVIASDDSGLEGSSSKADGLRGISGAASKSGVYGNNTAADGYGVYGRNAGNQNVGYLAGPEHGVLGLGTVANNAGVHGSHTLPGEPGVEGYNGTYQTKGILGGYAGVIANAPADVNALLVRGKAAFTRSGLVAVGAGKQSAKVAGILFSNDSFVLATPVQYRAGVWVAAAVPSPATGSFIIWLNKKVSSPLTVAWVVFERSPVV